MFRWLFTEKPVGSADTQHDAITIDGKRVIEILRFLRKKGYL